MELGVEAQEEQLFGDAKARGGKITASRAAAGSGEEQLEALQADGGFEDTAVVRISSKVYG